MAKPQERDVRAAAHSAGNRRVTYTLPGVYVGGVARVRLGDPSPARCLRTRRHQRAIPQKKRAFSASIQGSSMCARGLFDSSRRLASCSFGEAAAHSGRQPMRVQTTRVVCALGSAASKDAGRRSVVAVPRVRLRRTRPCPRAGGVLLGRGRRWLRGSVRRWRGTRAASPFARRGRRSRWDGRTRRGSADLCA